MIKFDMHCHTKAGSIDAKIPIERYIELLISHGFSGMLITDHDTYKGYRYFKNICHSITSDFTVLVGVEYDTRDAGHILVIMPDSIFLPVLKIRGMSIARLIKLVHQYGGILGPAHPFGTRYNSALLLRKLRKNPQLVNHFDFIEGFNTCESPLANQKAQALAKAYGKPCIGGSDSHKEDYVGMAFTAFNENITCNNDLISAITCGGIIAFGGTERIMLPKHKKRHSIAASLGFRAYNRSLGLLYSPYRQLKLRKLPLHRK
jgi:hypothetical protein